MGVQFFYRVLDHGDDSVEQIYGIEDYIVKIIQTVQTYERVNGHSWHLTGEREEVFIEDDWRTLAREEYDALDWYPTHTYEYNDADHSAPYIPPEPVVSTSAAHSPSPTSVAPSPSPTVVAPSPSPKPEPESKQFPIAIVMGILVGGYLALR